MTKTFDPALLDAERYPYELTITTRFADMDINGHINNVAMATAFEDARVRMMRERFDRDRDGFRPMVAAVNIDYLAQAHYPAPMVLKVGIAAMSRSSWTVAELALQDGKLRALCREIIVSTDGQKATPLPEEVRARLEVLRVRMP